MRPFLPLLLATALLLPACSDSYPVSPYSYSSGYNTYDLRDRVVGDPYAVRAEFDAALNLGKVDSNGWGWTLEGALKAGNKELFNYVYGQRVRVPGSDIKAIRGSLLAAAAAYKDASMLDWLLHDPAWKDVGFDLNAPAFESTGYAYGCATGCTTYFRPDPENQGFTTVLMQAVDEANPVTLDYLLAQGARLETLDADHANALNYAVIAGRKDLVDYFVAKGLSLNPTQAFPPLLTAAGSYRTEMAGYLLDKGAHPGAQVEDIRMDWSGESGLKASALTYALDNLYSDSSLELLRILLSKGVTPDKSEHAAALHHLFESHTLDDDYGVRALELMQPYKPDYNLKDAQGRTAVMKYLAYGASNAAKVLPLLKAARANFSAADNKGKTLLMYAAEGGSLPAVQFLVSHGLGSELGKKDDTGLSARQYANDLDVLRYLESIPRLDIQPS
ncbi:MAG: ankyrin repeat domain-containing protein [Candidatus Sericytochromatia bacterium]